ncbi:MAG: NAD(P)-binding domain-containing protein [Cyclobacteriaceae bacterium]|nr:NAD(P)-binding domain-containing protein [Cyclobacteriaceae bacterium]MCH8515425.1 NAD(P)-binding domain-containing protein [Cyclobacteriaceae bacterium]
MIQDIESIRKVALLGAGTMGSGIAQLSAISGRETIVYDPSPENLEKAQKAIESNITKGIEKGKLAAGDLDRAMGLLQFTEDRGVLHNLDLAIEAVPEKLEIKQVIFKYLLDHNSDQIILATNTSSIPITKIAAGLALPQNVVGFHFFNPAHIMKLVEVIKGVETPDWLVQLMIKLANDWGKQAVIAADSPGFIVNRVARHYYVEALQLLEEGVADHETIDALLEAQGFKMGPFRLMDLIGVDTNFSVTKSMYESFHYDSKFRPSRIQEKKVMAGHHGRKSGKGFYDYNKS